MDSAWLKQQFKLNPGKSKSGLAEATGLGRPAISKILAGTRQIKAAEYNAMRRYFDLPVDGEAAVTPGRGHVVIAPLEPQTGLREKGAPQDSSDAWVMPASLMQGRTRAQPDKIRIFPVQEKTMAPDFMPGEQVLVDLSDTKPSPPGVFVVSDGLGHIIRHCAYVPHSKPPSVRLTATGKKDEAYTAALKKAGIIGRVIAKLEWL